jgi:hypothetical protein
MTRCVRLRTVSNHKQAYARITGTAVMVSKVMSSNLNSNASAVHCERCGAPADFATLVQPLGDLPGAQVYQCPACKHLTWVEWWGWYGRPSSAAVVAQQPLDRRDEITPAKK